MSVENVSRTNATTSPKNPKSNGTHDQPPSSTSGIHLLYGLAGNLTGFLDEFEVSLKSVLLNSPLDYNLTIHLIVDEVAHAAASHRILHQAQLEGSVWRNAITIQFYPVQTATVQQWIQKKIATILPGKKLDSRITIGGYFRMFADELLPPGLGKVIYLDNDVVIMANLQELWRSVEATTASEEAKEAKGANAHRFLYHNGCSGFMIINFDRFHLFWHYLERIPLNRISHAGDQQLISRVSQFFPNTTGRLSPEWDVDLSRSRDAPQQILEKKKFFGYLHFNGIRPNEETFWKRPGAGLMQYCDRSADCSSSKLQKRKFRQSWMLADYYIRIPWSLTRAWGHSLVMNGASGQALTVKGSWKTNSSNATT